jgi:tetratricopeptide (TPR) repeat protein
MTDEGQGPTSERVPELAYVWRDLSELVQQARTTPAPAASNEVLQQQVDSDPEGPLGPPLLLWMGDNLLMEKQFAEAIDVFRRLVDRFPDRRFGEGTWASLALERMADCYERLGRGEEAVEALQRIADSHPEGRSVAFLYYRAAQIAEAAGRLEDAAAWYERASAAPDEPRETQVSIPDLARRNAERLRSNRSWMRPEPETLAKELARALEAGNADLLRELASPTHFSLGVLNGERVFVDRDKLLDLLAEELRRSRVRTDPFALEGSGEKRYLATEGWHGSFLVNRVVVLLSRTLGGWEWSGVALTQFPEAAWEALLGPPRKESNQALPLIIKSPWPSGLSFRAGGIIPFGAQLTACLALPGPVTLACLAALALASPCGFGFGGLYYGGVAGFNFTHGGDDFFAIDFARFVRGIPLLNATFATPVLCVQTGMVSGVVNGNGTGSTTDDNRVLVKHMTEGEFIMIVILEILSGQPLRPFATPRFTSMYLHLDGPFRIPVSPGMFARQGATLGPMDDTGLSVDHHLHFSIHDRSLPAARAESMRTPAGRSVRPTPMDGQRLIEADDGACVSSTNA